MERLAQMIAGEGANSFRLERARRVAEAEVDRLRVRRARSLLLDDVRARAKPPSVSDLIHADKQMMARRAEKQLEPWANSDDRTPARSRSAGETCAMPARAQRCAPGSRT